MTCVWIGIASGATSWAGQVGGDARTYLHPSILLQMVGMMVGLLVLSELTAGAECIVWWSGLMEGARWALFTCTSCNMKHYCARSVWWWAVRECIDWWWERTTVLTLLSDHLLWGCPHIIFWSWYPNVLFCICAHTLGSSYLSDQLLVWGAPLQPDSWFWFYDNIQDICVCNNQPVIVSFKCYFHPSLLGKPQKMGKI